MPKRSPYSPNAKLLPFRLLSSFDVKRRTERSRQRSTVIACLSIKGCVIAAMGNLATSNVENWALHSGERRRRVVNAQCVAGDLKGEREDGRKGGSLSPSLSQQNFLDIWPHNGGLGFATLSLRP